jgi:hypothetical protein
MPTTRPSESSSNKTSRKSAIYGCTVELIFAIAKTIATSAMACLYMGILRVVVFPKVEKVSNGLIWLPFGVKARRHGSQNL